MTEPLQECNIFFVANRDLFDAYLSTSFVVDAPGQVIRLRIGKPNPEADRLLSEGGVTTAAFITAWNPGSVPLSESENKQRQQLLQREIQQAGFHFFPGRGKGIQRTWPAEESVLILGISKPDAIALAERFGQLAIVWHERGQISMLLRTRDGALLNGPGRDSSAV